MVSGPMIQFGAAKKIVRLIFMSNISRRSFLKGAGVAALAVAAAGVLAGCSDKETPDTGAKRDVKLKYLSTSAGMVFGDVVIGSCSGNYRELCHHLGKQACSC